MAYLAIHFKKCVHRPVNKVSRADANVQESDVYAIRAQNSTEAVSPPGGGNETQQNH